MSGFESIRDEFLSLQKCGMSVLAGKRIGGGATRRVYELPHNPDMVLKLEFGEKSFCNVAEYDIWSEVKNTPLAKYFAPVVDIDVWGGALLMKRTKPITEEIFRRRVTKLPAFMCDLHWGNFGLIGSRVVCHDYGYHRAFSDVVKKLQLRAVRHTRFD